MTAQVQTAFRRFVTADALARAETSNATADNDVALSTSETYATVYVDGHPVATVSRPSRHIREGVEAGLSTLHGTDGEMIAAYEGTPRLRVIRRDLRAYFRSIAGLADMTREELAEEADDAGERVRGNAKMAAETQFGTFRASALTRAARAAYRENIARALLAQRLTDPAPVAQGPEGNGHDLPSCRACGAPGTDDHEECPNCQGVDPLDAPEEDPLAALRAMPGVFFAGSVDSFLDQLTGEDEDEDNPGPRSLSAAATPRELLDGYDSRALDTCDCGFPTAPGKRVCPFCEPEPLTFSQGGGFPLWAAAAERCAAAIDEALGLGLDIRDPFAPGWAEEEVFESIVAELG